MSKSDREIYGVIFLLFCIVFRFNFSLHRVCCVWDKRRPRGSLSDDPKCAIRVSVSSHRAHRAVQEQNNTIATSERRLTHSRVEFLIRNVFIYTHWQTHTYKSWISHVTRKSLSRPHSARVKEPERKRERERERPTWRYTNDKSPQDSDVDRKSSLALCIYIYERMIIQNDSKISAKPDKKKSLDLFSRKRPFFFVSIIWIERSTIYTFMYARLYRMIQKSVPGPSKKEPRFIYMKKKPIFFSHYCILSDRVILGLIS